jgi:hypothetical protein
MSPTLLAALIAPAVVAVAAGIAWAIIGARRACGGARRRVGVIPV